MTELDRKAASTPEVDQAADPQEARLTDESGDRVYRCEHGHKTATRTASGAWVGHTHPWWCPCQKKYGTLVILPRRGVNR